MRLHEKKPSTLSIADRTCLLQVFFRLVPQDIDAHAAIPRYLAWLAHLGRQSWQNIETTLSGGQSGRPGKEQPPICGAEFRDEPPTQYTGGLGVEGGPLAPGSVQPQGAAAPRGQYAPTLRLFD